MIRKIQTTNDLLDVIKSCPSGVIDDIYKIEYYIQGFDTVYEAKFTHEGDCLKVVLPSSELEKLENGILMRRAYYKVSDSSYPDGYYNLTFEDNMNVWLGGESSDPYERQYVTEKDLSKTLEDYALKTEVPSLDGYATQQWVESKGYVTAETLPEGIATESWVQSQGYLTEHQDLSSYALKSEIPSLDGYATEEWVNAHGYLTTHQPIKTVNNQSLIGEGNIDISGMTPAQESAVDVIVNAGDGYLEHIPSVFVVGERQTNIISGTGFRQQNLHIINGNVYLHNHVDHKLYKFNRQTYQFEEGPTTNVYEAEHLWSDSQGRVYSNNTYIVDLEAGYYEYKDMGGDFQIHTGSNYSNIIEKDGVVYMISYNNSCAYIFNEETQSFDSSIPIQGTFPPSNFYRNFSKFEDRWIYDVGQEQTELVFHLDEAEPYAEWVVLPERLFPGAWSYEYGGKTINETTRGVYVRPVVKNGVIEYYNWGYRNPVMYKLVNGAWEIVPFTMVFSDYKSQTSGVYIDDLWLGYGYLPTEPGIVIWNFGDESKSTPGYYDWKQIDLTPYAKTQWVQNNYATINLVDKRIDSLKEKYVYDPNSLIDSTGSVPLIDGKQIADIDMCITNTTSYPGPYIKDVERIENANIKKGYHFYFVTPSGRLIYTDPYINIAMEFNGTNWVGLESVTNFIEWSRLVELNDGLYAINNNDLCKWDDTNSDWVLINQPPYGEIWAADGNTMRCASNYKLVNNDGTYQWVEDVVVNYPGIKACIKLGQNYYYIGYDNNIYSYNENEKVFTLINSLKQPYSTHYFTYDDCLYYFAGNPDNPIIRKVNPSIDNYYDIKSDIYISNVDYVYAVYDNKLWTYVNTPNGDEWFGYTYSKLTPEVPATDGEYVLTGTRGGNSVTYSWETAQGGGSTPDLSSYATKTWVTEQGYLTEHQDLTGYALKSEIPSLDGYATESWVTNQGYITSVPDTFATKDWVSAQGYLTSHQDLSSYALKSEIPSLTGYVQETNLVTINDQPLIGEYNLSIQMPLVIYIDLDSGEYMGNYDDYMSFFANEYMNDGDNRKVIVYLNSAKLGIEYNSFPSDIKTIEEEARIIVEVGGYYLDDRDENDKKLIYYRIKGNYATQKVEVSFTTIPSDADIPDLTGYATETWVESKGYALQSEIPDMSVYALKSEIPSLTGYATESWVTSQGYTTQTYVDDKIGQIDTLLDQMLG